MVERLGLLRTCRLRAGWGGWGHPILALHANLGGQSCWVRPRGRGSWRLLPRAEAHSSSHPFQFPDIVEFSETMANAGKTVIVAALDGTFQRKVRRLVQVSGRDPGGRKGPGLRTDGQLTAPWMTRPCQSPGAQASQTQLPGSPQTRPPAAGAGALGESKVRA